MYEVATRSGYIIDRGLGDGGYADALVFEAVGSYGGEGRLQLVGGDGGKAVMVLDGDAPYLVGGEATALHKVSGDVASRYLLALPCIEIERGQASSLWGIGTIVAWYVFTLIFHIFRDTLVVG